MITAIDGEAVPDDGGLRRLLRGARDRRIEVAFAKPDGTAFRERRVPVSLERERDLAFERWRRRRRRDAVAARSCGRLGYVHVRAMNAASYRSTFAEVFGRFGRAEGLVVDVRFNGGGNLHNQLLTMLSGRPYLTFAPRTGPVQSDPRDRWSRPSAVLMNGASYSDASIFPQGYRDLGIGPLVGEPVAGTGTFVWWVPSRSCRASPTGCRRFRSIASTARGWKTPTCCPTSRSPPTPPPGRRAATRSSTRRWTGCSAGRAGPAGRRGRRRSEARGRWRPARSCGPLSTLGGPSHDQID